MLEFFWSRKGISPRAHGTFWVAGAVVGAGVIGAGAAIYSSSQQSSAAQSAAQTAAGAQTNAANLQYKMFEEQMNTPMQQAVQKQAPGAINALAKGYTMQDFQNSPAYQSMMGADQMLMQNAPAQYAQSGMLGSGNMQMALQQQAQLNALQGEQTGYTQWYQPLSAVGGFGQSMAQTNMAGSGQAGSNIGNAMVGAGNALAAGQVGQANAWANGINNVAGSLNSGVMNYLGYNQNAQMNNAWTNYLNGGGGGNALGSYNNPYTASNPIGGGYDNFYSGWDASVSPVSL